VTYCNCLDPTLFRQYSDYSEALKTEELRYDQDLVLHTVNNFNGLVSFLMLYIIEL